MGATLSSEDDLPQRDRWARLRFAIIGPLLAAPPAAGDLHEALSALAAKSWRHPFSGTRGSLRRLDHRTLALRGQEGRRSGAGAAQPSASRHRSLPESVGRGRAGTDHAVPRAPGLDRAAAPRQSAGDARRRRHEVSLVSERAAVSESPGAAASATAEARSPTARSPPVTDSNNARYAATKSSMCCSSCTWTSITAHARC